MPPGVAAKTGRERRKRQGGPLAGRRRAVPAGLFRVRGRDCQIFHRSGADDRVAGAQGRRGGTVQGSSFVDPAPFRIEPVVTGSSAPRSVAEARRARVPLSVAEPASQFDAQNDRKPTAATVFNVHIRTDRRRPVSPASAILISRLMGRVSANKVKVALPNCGCHSHAPWSLDSRGTAFPAI